MKLFHFTNGAFIEGIERSGLLFGQTPIQRDGKVYLMPYQQWLTKNPDAHKQVWHDPETTRLTYDRREYRFAVNIPDDDPKLYDWSRYKKIIREVMLPYFDADKSCKDWFVYSGHVLPEWLSKPEKVI